MSLLGKYIETNKGNKGVVVGYSPADSIHPAEWVLNNGYVFTEATMFSDNEVITLVEEVKMKEIKGLVKIPINIKNTEVKKWIK